jgi:hypothetical protein
MKLLFYHKLSPEFGKYILLLTIYSMHLFNTYTYLALAIINKNLILIEHCCKVKSLIVRVSFYHAHLTFTE